MRKVNQEKMNYHLTLLPKALILQTLLLKKKKKICEGNSVQKIAQMSESIELSTSLS